MRQKKQIALATAMLTFSLWANSSTYPIVGTGVTDFYSDQAVISEPQVGEQFYGQDAHYINNSPSYTDNGDGTITDNITGLMWQSNMGEKISWHEAFTKADSSTLGGYDDWRFPTLKELYSLIQFTGKVKGQTAEEFFIDTSFFVQPLGDVSLGEREIDAQTWSSTKYVGLTMNSDSTVFGVNFIDGRIKGYPQYNPQSKEPNTMYVRLVRGNSDYGQNSFVDNGDGTVSDLATGLMWLKEDDGQTRDWESALSYCENFTLNGHDDWRLPSIKELQSIVDYTRAPDITNSPAIDPLFTCTEISDPDGNSGHYGFYWSSTTHLDGAVPEAGACYIAFGEAQGQMTTPQGTALMDVHGAGAQRSDPKSGSESDYPQYWGPQGDVRYVFNFVRPVRTITEEVSIEKNTNCRNTTASLQFHNDALSITVPTAQKISIDLFSMNGRKVADLSDRMVSTGVTSIALPSATLSPGIYIVQVEGESISLVQSIILK